MAFNRLGIEVEMIGISEIDKYAIKSYNAIHGDTKNWGSICDIKGQDLPQIDVFTYSFPCTDLSKAGKQKGLNDTRSGLVYEVLRILQELKLENRLPKCLIMENVVDLVQVKFIRQFQEIQLELEQLGYSNYAQTLNAKHYGVAQNRDRIFMVSVLGEKYYEFPKPVKLEKRLKDYLENYVDEKYYLNDKMLKCFTTNPKSGFDRAKQFKPYNPNEQDYACAITTRSGERPSDNFIQIPEATLQGYSNAYEGDGVYINRPHQKRGVVQNQMIQTIKTSGEDVGVVVLGNYSPSNYGGTPIVDNLGLSPTVRENHGQVIATNSQLRIRKLTEREVWRLMGIDDKDFDKACQVVSKSQLYKQAGNGIVVDVFAAILSTMI
jgi:DNA (cytosine-5)-methyltransferase 1